MKLKVGRKAMPSSEKIRVLITGSAGFVGSHIVEHLLQKTNWEIIGVDSFRHRGDMLRLPKNCNGRYSVTVHDLNAPFSKRETHQIGQVDFIISCASESHVDRSIDEPIPFIRNNVALILHTLDFAMGQDKLRTFFQVSTDEVYGPANGCHRHVEWETLLPSNPYAASKAAQEMIAISYWRTYGLPLVITNTMNMIGERQDKEKFLPQLISKVHTGEKVIIHGKENDVGSRYYLHARNFADALLFLSDYAPKEYQDSKSLVMPDKFHIVGDVEIDNLTLAMKVAELMGKPLKYDFLDFHSARPGHDRRYALDGGKIAALGWKAPVNFEDSLYKTIEWTLKNPIWLK